MDFSSARVLDFTGASGEEQSYSRFGDDVIDAIRKPADEKLAIILDAGHGVTAPAMVRDHINLSGYNPLVGPNHDAGPRFPVLQEVYVEDDRLKNLEAVIVAGLRQGRDLDASDRELISKLGADCYCYNVVPTMIVAAHAGWKVLALVGPGGNGWQKDCLDKIGL